MTTKPECKECFEHFINKKQLEEHWSRFHQPPTFLPNGKIRLNASDQIRLVLKDMSGSWENYFGQFTTKKRMSKDFIDTQKLYQFEQDNNLEFIVCGSEVNEFRQYAKMGVSAT